MRGRPFLDFLTAALSCVVAACAGSGFDSTECEALREPAQPSMRALSEGVSLAQCGAAVELEPVNFYSGDFPNVQALEDSVVLVNGTCSGTLIDGGGDAALVLTAGHCVETESGDDAFVVFNHEDCVDGATGVRAGVVLERSLRPDYAIIELNEVPDVRMARLGRSPSEELAIIQHPLGRPKAIAEGQLLGQSDGVLRYKNLDTMAGSSGAGVLGTDGTLVAVHARGDCDEEGGSNSGWTTASIVSKSRVLSASVVD